MVFIRVSYLLACTLWLFTVVAAEWIRNEYLLISGNNGSFASITVKPRLGTKQTFNFHSHPISPACHSHPSRCRQLLVANFSSSQHVVLVPLESSIGIMEFNYESDEFIHRNTHVIDLSGGGLSHCIPLTIFKHRDSFYTVCFMTHRLFLCEIKVIATNITQSYKQCSYSNSILIDRNVPINSSLVSNFVSPDNKGHFVFAYGTQIYDVSTERLTFSDYRFGVEDVATGPCTRLSIINGTHLVVHCINQEAENYTTIDVYYDIDKEDWEISDTNIIYICPTMTSNVTTFLRESYIKYMSRSDTQMVVTINITVTDLYDGVCFGLEDNTTFVFLDRVEGLFAVNISARREQHISLPDQVCTDNSLCELLPVYNEWYIIIRSTDSTGHFSVIVLDARKDYSPIIATSHMDAALVTVISFSLNETTSAPSLGPPDPGNGGHGQSKPPVITVGVPVIITITIIGAAILVISLSIIRCKNGRSWCRNNEGRPFIPMSPTSLDSDRTRCQFTKPEILVDEQENPEEQQENPEEQQENPEEQQKEQQENLEEQQEEQQENPEEELNQTNVSSTLDTSVALYYDCEHSETNRQNPPYRYQDSEMNSIPDNDRDHFNLRNPTCDNVQDTNHVDNRSVMVTGHGN